MNALSLAALVALAIPGTAAALVTATQLTYTSDGGAATIDPFTINEPTSGLDLEISPAINFSNGSFVATLDDLSDGPATIEHLSLAGSLDVDIATTVAFGPIQIPVTATISGPLGITQTGTSVGSLVAATAYIESNPGSYDILLGPLDCTDTALGAVCSALETALGVTFPLEAQTIEDSAFPFTGGIFSDLDQPGLSTVGISLDFSVPIDAEGQIEVGAAAELTWTETARETIVLVPEPSVTLLLLLSLTVLARRVC